MREIRAALPCLHDHVVCTQTSSAHNLHSERDSTSNSNTALLLQPNLQPLRLGGAVVLQQRGCCSAEQCGYLMSAVESCTLTATWGPSSVPNSLSTPLGSLTALAL